LIVQYEHLQQQYGGLPITELVHLPVAPAALTILYAGSFDPGRHRDLDEFRRSYIVSDEFLQSYSHLRDPFQLYPNRYLDRECRIDRSDDGYIWKFIERRKWVPGALLPGELTADDAPALLELSEGFQPEEKSWPEFSAAALKRAQMQMDEMDPFLPRPFDKDGSHPNSWLRQCRDSGNNTVHADFHQRLRDLMRPICPPRGTPDRFERCPARWEMLEPVLQSVALKLKDFMAPVHLNTSTKAEAEKFHDQERWRHAPAVLFAAGFGAQGLFYLAGEMFRKTGELFWAQVCDLDPDTVDSADPDSEFKRRQKRRQLAELITKSHAEHGMPVGLALVDAVEVGRLLEKEPLTEPPPWFINVCMLHILKCCRFGRNRDGLAYIDFMYRTRHGRIPLDAETVPLTAPRNRMVLETLAAGLSMPTGTKGTRTTIELAHYIACSKLLPSELPSPIELPISIQAPERVVFCQSCCDSSRYFFKTQMAVSGIALLTKSGEVNKNAMLDGDGDAIAYAWPRQPKTTDDDIADWRQSLPDTVPIGVALGDVLLAEFPNVDDLGHPLGLRNTIALIIITELMRGRIRGSEIGALLAKEFALIFVLPYGAKKEETTNNAKTKFAEALAGSFVPGIVEIHANRIESAVAQRAAATQAQKLGSTIWGECDISTRGEHWLNVNSVVSMSTSGRIAGPGRVRENDSEIILKHPFLFANKQGCIVLDVLNRSISFFLKPLALAVRNDQDSVRMIKRIAMLLRLIGLRQIEEQKLIDRVRQARLLGGEHRFRALMSIAAAIGISEDIEAYLSAAAKQMVTQYEARQELGLVDDKPIFNPRRYWETLGGTALNDLICPGKTLLTIEALEIIVENEAQRKFHQVLASCGISEGRAKTVFLDQLEEDGGVWYHQDSDGADIYALRHIPKELSKKRRNRNAVAYIEVTRVGQPAVNPDGTACVILCNPAERILSGEPQPWLPETSKAMRDL
jgi:hypothetical protein